MTIIDSYPNVERTITSIEASLITPKEYQILKRVSKYVKEQIRAEIAYNSNNYESIKHNIEQFIKNFKYQIFINSTQKEIIIGNILLPDDISIAELLNKNQYHIEHLKAIMRFRALLKNVILYSAPIDEELERNFQIYKKYIARIIDIFKSEFNIDDQTIILNRITEILATNPNYFESKYSEHTKKR